MVVAGKVYWDMSNRPEWKSGIEGCHHFSLQLIPGKSIEYFHHLEKMRSDTSCNTVTVTVLLQL
jgi:hypothetical protein